MLTITERWERGMPHDPRSIKIAKAIAKIDWEHGGDFLGLELGGDGDNGEYLLYLLDIYFEMEDGLE
jgi:hypothetical protein